MRATREQATPTIRALGSVSAMFEEPRDHDIAPRLVTADAMEADMAARRRQERHERLVGRPIIAAIERLRNPGTVARRQHQGRHADIGHEAEWPAAFVVGLRTAETVMRGNEDIVVL